MSPLSVEKIPELFELHMPKHSYGKGWYYENETLSENHHRPNTYNTEQTK
jgi:hypothetical protein